MADLGFNVDTGGLDKAQASLDKTTQSAAKTEQQANKTSEALNKIGASQASASISKTAQSADQLAASLVKASSAAQQHLNVAQALETIVTKTGVSYASANAALTAAISANTGAAAAATEHAGALGKVEQAAAGIAPKLNEAGVAAGGLSRAFSIFGGGGGPPGGSIAAGLGAVGGAAGIAAAALAALAVAGLKTADDYARIENRFQAITGNMQTGTALFNSIREAAKNSGGDLATFARAAELASQGANKLGASALVFSKNALGLSSNLRGLPQLLEMLQKAMQESSATEAEESKVFNELFGSIANGGKLTVEAFDKIYDTLPEIGRLIAKSFGYQQIQDFRNHLAQVPETVQDLIQNMLRLKPAIDAAFHPESPKMLEEAFRNVSRAFTDLEVTLAQTGAFNGVKNVLGAVSEAVKQDGEDIKWFAEIITSLGQTSATVVSGIAADFVKLGNVIAGVIAKMANAGAAAQSAEAAAMPGAPQSGIQLDQSGGSSDPNSYGYFATGGSFTVGGSGGTDSQLVSFHATPGEQVTISGGVGGDNTLAPTGHVDTGGSTGDMAIIDAINNGSTAIVNAIHGMSGGTSLSGATNSIVSATTTAASSTSSDLQQLAFSKLGPLGGGIAGGGGSSSSSSSAQSDAQKIADGGTPDWANPFSSKYDQKKVEAYLQANNPPQSGGYPAWSPQPGTYGQLATPARPGGIVGATSGDPFHPIPGPWPLTNILGGGSEIGGASGEVKGAVNQTTTAVRGTTDAVGQSGQDIVSGAQSNTGSIISTLNSVATTIAQAVAAAASAAASGGASGGGVGSSYGGGYSGGSSSGGYYSSGGYDYSTGGDYSGGGSYYSGGGGLGSEIGGSGGSFDPYGGGGFDPGAIDYGGGSSGGDSGSYGYFATGGQFAVGGRGGIDSHAVRFRATPGEIVTITPPGGMPPPSPTGITGGNRGRYATGGQFAYGYTSARIPPSSTAGGSIEADHQISVSSGGVEADHQISRVADAVARAVTRAIPGSYGGPYEDNQSKWSGGVSMSGSASREQSTGSSISSGDRTVTIVVQAGVQAEQFLRSRAQIARAFR